MAKAIGLTEKVLLNVELIEPVSPDTTTANGLRPTASFRHFQEKKHLS